ncbi:MAG: hypothetical protein AAB691_00065 [Patescibacteria group bacterium]
MKRIAICGGAGHLACYVRARLHEIGAEVFPFVRTECQKSALGDQAHVVDVGRPDMIEEAFKTRGPLDGLVYAVGRCRPDAFKEANSMSLNELFGTHFPPDMDRLVYGLQNVCKVAVNIGLRPGGVIVVVGSAINSPNYDRPSSQASVGPYAVAQAAQAQLIKEWRENPVARMRKIVLHYLTLGPVEGPFWGNSPQKPTEMLEPEKVAKGIVGLFKITGRHFDVEHIPGTNPQIAETPIR